MKYISSRKKGLSSKVIVSALSMSACGTTLATENNDVIQLPLIEVTATADSNYLTDKAQSPKIATPLVETPRSITIINENLIKDTAATSLLDVLRTTPGITLGSGEGGTPVGDRPFVRGYEASTDILIDGMRDYARGSHETFNLEAVEVSKGPGSAYSGRGSTGGSINLVTKKPMNKNFTEISGSYNSAGLGADGKYRLTLDSNYAFTDSIAARLNLMKDEGEIAGRGGIESDRLGISPSITIGLNGPTRLNIDYSYLENNDTPDLGLPFKNEANPSRLTPIETGKDHRFYGRKDIDFRDYTSESGSIGVEHDFNDDISARAVVRKIDTENYYFFTRPSFDNCTGKTIANACKTEGAGLEFTRTNRSNFRSSESLVGQTDVFGSFNTGTIKHQFSVGLEYAKEEIFNRNLTVKGAGAEVVNFYHIPSSSYPDFSITKGAKTDAGHIKTLSAYLFDTVSVLPKLDLNFGLRYDDYEVDNTTTSRTDKMWNYQFGAVYKPVANSSIYATYATSSNPSGENLGQNGGADGAAGAAQIRELKPEKSNSIELGTKWQIFDEKLLVTGAIFQTEKTDARSADPITGEITLDGNNRVRGAEVGVSGKVTPQWNIAASYTYLDPEVTHYVNGKGAENRAGNQMKFTAKNSYNLWSSYEITPKFEVGGGLVYVDKRFVDDANEYYLPSHTRWDAMAKYSPMDALTLQLNLNNLTDEKIYDASHVGIFSLIAPGRSATVSMTYRFE